MITEKTKRNGTADAPPLDEARAILRAAIPRAAEVLTEALEAEDPVLRLRAAAAILNRAGLTEAGRPKPFVAARDVGGEKSRLDLGFGL